MSNQVQITGLDDLSKVANPKQLKNAALAALSSGAAVPKKGVRNALPSHLKKFKSILKHKRIKSSRKPLIELGFFGRVMQYVNRRGVSWDAFTILYWHNYGTLNNRDSSHNYQQSRKRVSASWRGGISGEHFWEDGINSTEEQALQRTEKALDNQIDKILTKNGFK